MKTYQKKDYPVNEVRKFLEPGPIVLVTSAWKEDINIMTMGWHTIMESSPSLIGCYIWDANFTHKLIRKSKECVINLPTIDLIDEAVGIGNTSGRDINKFIEFNLTPEKSSKVDVPLIKECYANFECQLYESKMINKYNFFVFEVVKAHVAESPKYPKTFHYTGEGIFMLSGKHQDLSDKFLYQNL